jgi:hypothetical protein
LFFCFVFFCRTSDAHNEALSPTQKRTLKSSRTGDLALLPASMMDPMHHQGGLRRVHATSAQSAHKRESELASKHTSTQARSHSERYLQRRKRTAGKSMLPGRPLRRANPGTQMHEVPAPSSARAVHAPRSAGHTYPTRTRPPGNTQL